MRGLELARAYYEECGKPWIHREFPEFEGRIAVGLAGEGSECFGFDDEISRDHDFEPGFCVWIPEEDETAVGFKLMRGYKKLPDTFMGVTRRAVSLFGGGRRGVHGIAEFYGGFTGCPGAPEDPFQWLRLPEHSLACAVNGQVFRDDLGEFSRIRNEIGKGYPRDARLKKLAARAATMAQSGQYNFSRCAARGEYGAAALALSEFVTASVSMFHLLCGRYAPYYKWGIRSLREMEDQVMEQAGVRFSRAGIPMPDGRASRPRLGAGLASALEELLTEPTNAGTAAGKAAAVERIAAAAIDGLRAQGLTGGSWDYLEPHAMEIMERIGDPMIRNMHVMEG